MVELIGQGFYLGRRGQQLRELAVDGGEQPVTLVLVPLQARHHQRQKRLAVHQGRAAREQEGRRLTDSVTD